MVDRRRFLAKAAALAPVGAGLAAPALAHVETTEDRATRCAPYKLAIAAYSFRDYLQGAKKSMTLFDFIRAAARLGTDGVELTEYYFEKPITHEYLLELKRQCHLWGQDITGTPIGNSFTAPAGPERDKQIATYKQWVDVSAVLGSPVIRTFAGSAPSGVAEKDARRNVIDTLGPVCEYAAKKGIFVGLENHGGVVAEADGLLEIVQAVGSPWLGINLDTGNFRTADPYGDLARCAPYAVSVQFKLDMAPKGKPAEPGDFPRILEILRNANYRGHVALEYESKEEPWAAIPRALAMMRKAMLQAA